MIEIKFWLEYYDIWYRQQLLWTAGEGDEVLKQVALH